MEIKEEKIKDCLHLECQEKEIHTGLHYCNYHLVGGVFGNGEIFEQYQIIENDFIEFIKVVPIDEPNHLSVHSPLFRDIILRSCIQIEIFFKEWGKFVGYDPNSELYELFFLKDKKTGIIKGAKNWNFRDYYIFNQQYNLQKPIHVGPLHKTIAPFEKWTSAKETPEWWNVYNSIKHNGIKSKKEANLEIALYSLAALFTLHITNRNSKRYLSQYSITYFDNRFSDLKLNFSPISTPLGSRKYLFKDLEGATDRSVKILTEEKYKRGGSSV